MWQCFRPLSTPARIVAATCLLSMSATMFAEETAAPAAEPEIRMGGLHINGYSLAGAEYWPYVGQKNPYPTDVLWGFYPSKASKEAIACAETAWTVLKTFMEENHPLMVKAKELGICSSFFQWTNDYQLADPSVQEDDASMWHWGSSLTGGFWKWMSTVDRNGNCHIPERDANLAALEEAILEMQPAPESDQGE